VPRGDVVNARRPGRRPGRSEAESIDDAEHGDSIERAMVGSAKLGSQVRHFLLAKLAYAQTDCSAIRRPFVPVNLDARTYT
jgi:hypothetical protein